MKWKRAARRKPCLIYDNATMILPVNLNTKRLLSFCSLCKLHIWCTNCRGLFLRRLTFWQAFLLPKLKCDHGVALGIGICCVINNARLTETIKLHISQTSDILTAGLAKLSFCQLAGIKRPRGEWFSPDAILVYKSCYLNLGDQWI